MENRFTSVDISNYEFTQDVKDALETLVENYGLDLPDEVFSLIPYTTEIILGTRLLIDLMNVNRDFSKVEMSDKARISAVKVLVLMARFGVSSVLIFVLSTAGTAALPGYGTAAGGIGGAVTAGLINKKIAPYTLDLSYKLLNISPEEMFYYKNVDKINTLLLSFQENKESLRFD